MRSLNKNGLSGKRSMQVNPWVYKNMEVWWVRLMSKKAACWSRLAVRSSSWSNVVWMNLRNNWQTPRFGSDANSNLSRSRGRPAVHRKRWKRSVPEPLISRRPSYFCGTTIFLKELNKTSEMKMKRFPFPELFGPLVVPLPLTGSHRESDDSAGWTLTRYAWLAGQISDPP